MRKNLKIGLALSGGGARGVAYIGVFKALKQAGIKIDFVAGTSVGALASVVFSSGIDLDKVEEMAKNLTTKDILTRKMFFLPGETDKLQGIISSLVPYTRLEDLPITTCIVTCDMIKAEEVDFVSGDISKVVAGSCSMPGFFEPVIYEKYHLMDGGLINNIPANKCREAGCDIVIIVDINSTRGYGTTSVKMFDCVTAAMRILMKNNSFDNYQYGDIIIQPNLKKFKSTRLDNVADMIEEGYVSTMAMLPRIDKVIASGGDKSYKKLYKHQLKYIKKKDKKKS